LPNAVAIARINERQRRSIVEKEKSPGSVTATIDHRARHDANGTSAGGAQCTA
jgi:hypothetical protein